MIVFAIGLVGAFIWTTISRENISQNGANSEDKKPGEIEPGGETADWNTETIKNYNISFRYPSEEGWKSTVGITDSSLSGHEANLSVSYTKCGPNCGFVLSIQVLDNTPTTGSQKNFGEDQMQGNTLYTLTSTKPVTIDGTRGTRWEYTPRSDSSAKVIYYYFSTDDYSYMLTVNSNGAVTDDVDITAMGERIVQTIRFIK